MTFKGAEGELQYLLWNTDKTMKAVAIESGISYSTILGIRAGQHHPSLYTAEKLAASLGKKLVLT